MNNSSPEKNIDNVDNKAKKSKNILPESQENFVKEKITSDKNFFDWKDVSQIFGDFRKFLNSKEKYKELWLQISGYNQDQQEALVEQINFEKVKFLFVLDKSLDDLIAIFSKEYDSSLNVSKLKSEISKVEFLELKKMMKSETKRREFLKNKKIFSDEKKLLKSKKLDEENLLDNIWISKKSLKNFTEDQKEQLFSLFNSHRKIELVDLENILLILEDEKSKQNLLKFFITTVSIEELEKNNLFSSKAKEKIIKSIENKFSISKEEAKNVYNSLDKSEIFLSIDELENLDFQKILNDKSIQKSIVDEYNSEIKEAWIWEKLSSKLSPDKKWNIHNSFINFVKTDTKISNEIRLNIEKLAVWNYLEISDWNKKWYYFIKNVDRWSSISSKSMTFENITAEWWIKKLWTWFDEEFSYERFYQFLQIMSSSENTNLKVNLFTPEEFSIKWVSEKIDSVSEINNYDDLLKWLNTIDPEGEKHWLSEEWTVILDGKNWFVFLIEKIDKKNQQIVVNQGWYGNKKISFKDFYSVLKSSNWNLKRDKKINSFSEVVNSLAWDTSFSGLNIDSGKIFDKNKDKDKKFPIEFFESWKKWLLVKNISENSVEYLIWDIEEKEWKKILKNAEKSKNLTQFYKDLKENELSPVINPKLEEENSKKWKELDRKTWFFKKIMSGLSISEIIAWGNFWIEWIKKKLETGNRLKSLKFAQKFWGLLWKDMKLYLKSRAEQEEKWLIDEISSSLKALDSGPMVEQILEIIKNKGSEQYEIIWAMMAVTKYWNLYPKWLSEYAWTFMWYKLLWGTEKFKREQEEKFNKWVKPGHKDYRNFTEEELMTAWLKFELWKKGKVRSKLWKDFAVALGSATNDEYEWWKNQAWAHTTFPARYNEFEGFLAAREYAWSIWALEKVFWKNGDPENMNKAPFVLAISGLWKYFNPTLIAKLQEMQVSFPYTSLMYCTSEHWAIQYRNFIRTLIKTKFPEDKTMLSDYESVLKSPEYGDYSIVKTAGKFWNKHWKKISEYLSFQKADIIYDRDKNSDLNNFYKTSKAMLGDDNFSFKEDAINDWVYNKNNVFYFWNGMSKIRSDQAWSFWWPEWEFFYKRHLNVLDDIKNYNWSMEDKKRIFKEVFAKIEEKVRNAAWIWADRPLENAPFTNEFYKRWLTLADKTWWPERYDKFLEENFYNFMNRVTPNVWNTITSTKLSIDDLLK